MKPIFLVGLFLVSTAWGDLIPWSAQTSSIPSVQAGDPAFVRTLRRADGGTGLVLGTDTAQVGLYSWFPGGQLDKVFPVGLVNSVDARGSLVAVSSGLNSVLLFSVTGMGTVTQLHTNAPNIPSPGQLALAQHADGGFEVWVDTKSLSIEHLVLFVEGDGGVTMTSTSPLTVPQVPTGLAIDDRTGRLYVSQPTLGVLALDRDGSSHFAISIDAGTVGPTVGGVDLFLAADGSALLFSASPLTDEIKVHRLVGDQATFLASLQIGAPQGEQGLTRMPWYVDVYEQPVPGFPQGILVVHDGASANYKVVSLADVASALPIPAPFIPQEAVIDPEGDVDGGIDAGKGIVGAIDGGRPGGPGPSAEELPQCGCSGAPLVALSVLALLWWTRRVRS